MTGNTIGVAPETHHDVYPALEASKFMGTLKDKAAFITGAGRGIGKAIALALAQAGAHVALLARTESQLDEVADEIKSKYGRKALVFAVDGTDGITVAAAFQKTENELGKLDILVANAGMGALRPFALLDFDREWWRVMEVNVKAPLFLIQLAIKSMRERSGGTIIAISSDAGVLNFPGLSAYCSSKAALNRAIGCLQLELDAEHKSGIALYAVHPGGVKTQLTNPSVVHDDMDKMTPGTVKKHRELLDSFINTPELCAQTCVYLATSEKPKELRGRFVNAECDIESLVNQAEIIKRENLYDLGIRELGS